MRRNSLELLCVREWHEEEFSLGTTENRQMESIVSINPFRCRVWSLHDRLECQITEESCRAEIASFMKHGQLIPVLGRPLRGDAAHDVELICGARRLFAARYVNMPLKVELRDLSDQEAIVAMDIENRLRMDVSPYERGMSYAQWLRDGYFGSQDDISRALRISASQVSRLLKMSKLPTVVVSAFHTPLDIREEWAIDIVDALSDPGRRAVILQRARAATRTQGRPAAREIYQQLLAAPGCGGKQRNRVHDEIVKDDSGRPLFRIRHQTNSLAVVLPLGEISDKTKRRICEVLKAILSGTGRASSTSYADTVHLVPGGEDVRFCPRRVDTASAAS